MSSISYIDVQREGTVLMQVPDGWLAFANPVEIVTAQDTAEIASLLEHLKESTGLGRYVAGFLCYEAAPGIDSCFTTHPPSDGLPLAWFGVYESLTRLDALPDVQGQRTTGLQWTPNVTETEFTKSIDLIKEHIRQGDTYQANFTFRLRAPFLGNPYTLFVDLVDSQRCEYSAYLNAGRWRVCSVSPELFFEKSGNRIRSKPMKGTIERGLHLSQDNEHKARLVASAKDRAENVMIVDMIRNDIGRVADVGSVRVESLYDVEQYPTIFQLTSTVEARTDAHPVDILRVMFPCASITGAPKIRTMEIIRDLESEPRGLYTGTVGYMAPEGDGRFNVAIRTVVLDEALQSASYGVGSGIVWDSTADQEFAECLTKARVLDARPEPFELLETLRWEPTTGYLLLDQHLDRLRDAAVYFSYSIDTEGVRVVLEQQATGWQEARRVRLTVSSTGDCQVEGQRLKPLSDTTVVLDTKASATASPFCFHKTTNRSIYSAALARNDGDDVLLKAMTDEVTESTLANIVWEQSGEWFTPRLSVGLLPGLFRAELLRHGLVAESTLRTDMLGEVNLWLVNSVRGWMRLTPVAPGTWRVQETGFRDPSKLPGDNSARQMPNAVW